MSAMVEVEGIVKLYPCREGRGAVAAVDGVSFIVQRGEILGLLGPNGAGKTTTIKAICGLVMPDRGCILVNGYDVQRERLRSLRHISAVLEGNRNLYWRLTAKENLEYFAGNRGRSRREVQERIAQLLEQFRLSDKAGEPVNRLSRGMQQKLAIAVAMLAETDVLLLDEPTLGLDVGTAYEARDLLRQIAAAGRTLIVSTHDMAVVQAVCDRAVIINAGRVIADDRVTHLLKLFETKAYVITLRVPLSGEQRTRVQARFPLCSFMDGEHPALEVCLEHGEEIYDLLEILRQVRAPIEAVNRAPTNFERIFLELVRGREPTRPAESLPRSATEVISALA